MRNNADRVGVPQEESDNNQTTQSAVNPWARPQGQHTIELPTRGRFYPDGHPLKDKEFVIVRSMATEEEEIITNQDLIKEGLAFDKLLQNIQVEPRYNTQDLFIVDKNALLVAVRKNNIEKDYEASLVCRNCGQSNPIKVDLNTIECLPPHDHILSNGTFEVALGDGYIAICRLLTGKDETNLQKIGENKRKHKLKEEPIKEQLKKMVVKMKYSKDGVESILDDRHQLEEWLSNLELKKIRTLRKEYGRLIPSIDFTYDLTCSACRKEAKVPIPFNPSFFWPE